MGEAPKELKGVALIIGQSDYKHVGKLPNPENDARAIEEMFDKLGFQTDVATNRDARKLKRDLESFVDDAEGADVAIIYYSGHGIEAGGENFLVPVDADISALDDAGEKLVPLSSILTELKAKVPVTIVLLDACRNDPFPPGTLL
ncbi:MAG: caspase family protein, partial [Mesorhizobium sp.]